MHQQMKTVKEFIESPYRNAWLSRDGQAVYVRKSIRTLGGREKLGAFDIANIETPEKKQGKGRFKQFLHEVEVALEGTTYDAIYVENVLVPRFAEFFRNTGWTEIEQSRFAQLNMPCFYKLLKLE